MICPICEKDHSKKQTGLLSICETKAWMTNGTRSLWGRRDKYAIGAGSGRFQFKGAK